MKIDVSHTAKLANLQLSAEEKQKFEKELEKILSYIDKLKEVETKNIEPTSQITNLKNITREDKTSPSLTSDQVHKNTKSKHNGFFKVPAIFD